MTIAQVKIRDIRPNPFRDFDEYPLIPNKVEALTASIQETGFWNNILGRINQDGAIKIAYGHHRLEAARLVLGEDHQIAITLRDMTDIEMFRIMGLENSEDWMNSVHHTEQVIKQARAFFDSWLDRFPAWTDFVQGVLQNPLAEFGQNAESSVRQVTDWLGGAAEAAHNYANIVKYGVGATILHRFTGIAESTVKAVLAALGPTEREKRMLEQIEVERKAAETEIRKQQEAKEKAEREQKEAERELREAEEERRRQAAIAQRAQDEHRQHEAKAKVAELTATKECSKKKIETAQHSQKQASQAIKAAEEKAKTVTKAEAQKRVAVEKQAHYDDKVNKVWKKWVHVNAFRGLCLEPGHQQILPKSKQVEFARYLKKSIQGEITVARIQDTFRAHVRNFLAGIRAAQKKKKTPIETLETLLKEWVSAMAAAGKKRP